MSFVKWFDVLVLISVNFDEFERLKEPIGTLIAALLPFFMLLPHRELPRFKDLESTR